MLDCCHFAADGMGVAIADDLSVRAAGAELVAVPFSPRIDVSYFAIRPPGAQSIAILDAIVERMQGLLAPREAA